MMRFENLLWTILTSIITSGLIGYSISVRIRMFDKRFEMFKDIRKITKHLFEEYNNSVKMSFIGKDESDQNVIGFFLNESLEEYNKNISSIIIDTPFKIDPIHRMIINKHTNKITKYIKDKVNSLATYETDDEFHKLYLKEINGLRLRF